MTKAEKFADLCRQLVEVRGSDELTVSDMRDAAAPRTGVGARQHHAL